MFNSSDFEGQSIDVYCTRPGCQRPENTISYQQITSRHAQCAHCGMRLILPGNFVALNQIGQGGFGTTYMAINLDFIHTRRVIKQLNPNQPGQIITPDKMTKMQEKFEEEAITLDKLKHPKIPKLLAFFSIEVEERTGYLQNFFYLVQEYVEGQNLAQELEERRQRGENFSENEVIVILKEILEILRYIHNHGDIIHRDIKPSNIMRSQHGTLYLIDFGSVKKNVDGKTLTMIGSEAFAPYEQSSGRGLYPASDLYALAATCLCLLTGNTNPNQLLDEEDIKDILSKYKVRNQRFARALELMLKHRVKDRPQSAQEVIDILDGRQQSQVVNLFNRLRHYISDITSSINHRVPIKWVALALLIFLIVVVSPHIVPPIKAEAFAESLAEPLRELMISQQNENAKYFSRGEKSLVPELNHNDACKDVYQAKQDGMAAFKEASETGDKEKFDKARLKFRESIDKSLANQKCIPDPETRIQEYNAIVAKTDLARQGKLPTIVIVNQADKISSNNEENKRKSIIGLEILRGVAQALDELDKNNPLFQILLANYTINNSNAIAQYISNQPISEIPGQGHYFNKSKILGVIGRYKSDYIKEVGDIYGNGKIVLIAPTSTAFREYLNREGQQLNKYVFRTASNDSIASEDLANYIKTYHANKKTLIVYNDSNEYSRSLQRELELKLGTNSRPKLCNLTPNGNAQTATSREEKNCIERVTEDIGVLVLFPSSDYLKSAVEIAKKVKKDNPDIKLIGGDVVYDKETLSLLGDSAEGMVIAVSSHASMANGGFQAKAEEFWKTRYVSWRTMTTYDAVKVFWQAVETSNPSGLDQDGKRIYEILTDRQDKFSVKGANADVEFDSSNDREENPDVGVLVQVKRNNTESDEYNFAFDPNIQR